MSKIFLAYRFNGENLKELEPILTNIRDSLKVAGHDVFCSYWLEDGFNAKRMTQDQRYDYCAKQLDSRDIFMAFVKSKEKSKGIQIETDAAVSQKKRYVLAIKKGLEFPELRKVANQVIEYSDYHSLYHTLKSFK
jgi:hypothetical protein